LTALFDQFGREVTIKKRPEPREIAVATIRDRWSSYPSKGLTPERLGAIFREADGGDILRQSELFEEMEEKDAHLFSILQTRKNAVRGLGWEVDPFSDGKKDIDIATACDEMLSGIENFDDALLDLLDALSKGIACCEIIWEIKGSTAIIKRLPRVHQKLLNYFNSFIPTIRTEANPWPGEEMPPFKFVIHRYKARSGYDTRAGILRACAWMYLFKNYGIKDLVVFAEVYGMPLRLGKYEPGASKEDKEALITAVSSLGTDAAGIISTATQIEFIESASRGTGRNVYLDLVDFCNREMSKAVLGHTGSAESTPGKLGAEYEAREVRQDLIENDCEALATTIRWQILRPFVGFNYGWDAPVPWFKFAFEPPEDLKSVAEVYVDLGKMGYPLTAEHVSERFKVPLPEKDQQILVPATGTIPFTAKRSHTDLIKNKKDVMSQGDTGAQNSLDRMITAVLKSAPDAIKGLSKPIIQAIQEAETYEEIQAKLTETFSEMEPAQLEDLVARSMFAAEMWGRYQMQRETESTHASRGDHNYRKREDGQITTPLAQGPPPAVEVHLNIEAEKGKGIKKVVSFSRDKEGNLKGATILEGEE
jgi:phage gp29-like protein